MVIRLGKKGTTVGISLIFFLATFVAANAFAKAGGKGLKVQVFVTKPFEVSGEAKITTTTNADYDLFESIFAPIGRSFHMAIQFLPEVVGDHVSVCVGLEGLRGCDSTINGPEKEPEQVYINLGTGNGNDFGSESSSSSAALSESSSSAS